MMLITTLVLSFLVCCMLQVRCGQAGVVSGLQAKEQLVLQPACIVQENTYIYIYIYIHICSNGRNEMRKLCTINNSAKSRPIDINIISDGNQYFYIKNYPDIHNRRINCSCVAGSPFMYCLYIYIYNIYVSVSINNT